MYLLEKLKSGWTTLKFIRVGLGILILSSSVVEGHLPGIILGVVFTGISLITEGVCCFGGSCATINYSQKTAEQTEIEYEELGTK